MKMLTGLLARQSEGERAGSSDRKSTRRTSQCAAACRLYVAGIFALRRTQLCEQNLVLHARLFNAARGRRSPARVERTSSNAFRPGPVSPDALPDHIAAGHPPAPVAGGGAGASTPELLILDEPTSGVDPIARDMPSGN
jgi:ribosome-dependent ATPase